MNFDKNIPIPTDNKTKIGTLRSMEIGDSFLVPHDEASTWRGAMCKASETGERYFISRSFEDGVRIWRKA